MAEMAVYLVPHDPQWTEAYAEQAARVGALLAPWGVTVEHVGSTAVPGLPAKPIVDVLAVVDALHPEMVPLLAADGWLHWAGDPTPGRLWFLRPSPEARTHHLHVYARGDERALAQLAFRDALRADPALAADYAALKARLAAEHPGDREAYTAGKTDFVQRASFSARNRSAGG